MPGVRFTVRLYKFLASNGINFSWWSFLGQINHYVVSLPYEFSLILNSLKIPWGMLIIMSPLPLYKWVGRMCHVDLMCVWDLFLLHAWKGDIYINLPEMACKTSNLSQQ